MLSLSETTNTINHFIEVFYHFDFKIIPFQKYLIKIKDCFLLI